MKNFSKINDYLLVKFQIFFIVSLTIILIFFGVIAFAMGRDLTCYISLAYAMFNIYVLKLSKKKPKFIKFAFVPLIIYLLLDEFKLIQDEPKKVPPRFKFVKKIFKQSSKSSLDENNKESLK